MAPADMPVSFTPVSRAMTKSPWNMQPTKHDCYLRNQIKLVLEPNPDPGEVLSTGYSLEIVGNKQCDLGATHADQCCFTKVVLKYALTFAKAEEHIKKVLPKNSIL